jgi:hypothetical protein
MMKTLAEISATRKMFTMAAIEVERVLDKCRGQEQWSTHDLRDLMIAMWLRGFEWRDDAKNAQH